MARQQVLDGPRPPVEHPELVAAYAGEREAVRVIAELKTRKIDVACEIERLTQERDGLASRMARGATVSGSDLRKANEAISDAEGTLELVTRALPEAVRQSYAAQRARLAVERDVVAEARRPYADALATAERALQTAQTAHARAQAQAERMPADAQAELDALLDGHGRDEGAAAKIAEFQRMESANRSRAATGLPLVEWP